MNMLIADKEVGSFKDIINPGTYSNYRKQKVIHKATVVETLPVTVNSIYELDKRSDLAIPEEDIKKFASEKFAEYILRSMSHTKVDKGEVIEHKFTVVMLEDILSEETMREYRDKVERENSSVLNILTQKNTKLKREKTVLEDEIDALNEKFNFADMEVLTAKNELTELKESNSKERIFTNKQITNMRNVTNEMKSELENLNKIKDKYESEGFWKSFFRKIKNNTYEV
jgi:predicted RNase H-like nuclease (RuvC/YqgF family)